MALYGKVISITHIRRDGVLVIRPECPRTGTGERAVHKWIYRAACECKRFCKTEDQAFDIIADGVVGCGRVVTAREINDTLTRVYGSGSSKRTAVRPGRASRVRSGATAASGRADSTGYPRMAAATFPVAHRYHVRPFPSCDLRTSGACCYRSRWQEGERRRMEDAGARMEPLKKREPNRAS
jgi:hypothetical protein